MNELILKYNLLDSPSRKKVLAFMDELLGKQLPDQQSVDMEAYKKKLLTLPSWDEESLTIIEEAAKQINWKPEEW